MTETQTKSTKLKAIIKGIGAFLIVTMSLFHVFFESKSKEQILHAPKYKQEVQVRDKAEEDLLIRFEKDLVSKKEFIEELRRQKEHYKSSLKTLSDKRKALAREHSFRGRSSFHFWLFAFGLVSALFFFSCKSLYDDIVRSSKFKFHLVSISGVIVSCFYFIHLIFLTQNDFNKNKYFIVLLVCAILFSAFTYFLVKNYTYREDIILNQLSFIERIRTIHYPKIAIKARYAEKYGEVLETESNLEEQILDFEKDLINTIKNS
jgi:hypothetical protein